MHKNKDQYNKCGNWTHAQGFQYPAKKYQCKVCHKYGHFSSLCYQKRIKLTTKTAKETQRHINWMQSFCLQLQVQWNQVKGKKISNPVYLISNLAYQLKLNHSRNMYLWARLDTCADVNIVLASVYHLIFKDLEMKKITPCKMQIGTYTADMVKIVGSCTFYVIHPDSKELIPVTFYVATNEGTILLSYKTTLALHLIQPRSRLDYLTPWASLITLMMDYLKKTRPASLKVHSSQQ